MSVTVTIPVGEILRWCAIWVGVGLVLFPLLSAWGSTFVSPPRRGWDRFWPRNYRVRAQLVIALASSMCWPYPLVSFSREELKRRGLFLETGAPPEGPERRPWSVLTTRRRLRWVVFGSYRTTDFGSRWIAVGPVTVGVKRPRWAFVKGFAQ